MIEEADTRDRSAWRVVSRIGLEFLDQALIPLDYAEVGLVTSRKSLRHSKCGWQDLNPGGSMWYINQSLCTSVTDVSVTGV